MTDRKFTVIKGGLSTPQESDRRVFRSAFATDTRLMGVVGLYIHWDLETGGLVSDFHQFFYFDAEEYGFETYRSILGDDIEEITFIEQALMGGLGGTKIDLTEKEACCLIQEYTAMNRRLNLPMPDKKKEYQFLIDAVVEMTPEEERKLFAKQCAPIVSEFQAINYFLMRCFSKDFAAAEFLRKGDFPLEIFDDIPSATLCKNSIDIYENPTGISYLCESLIEFDASYTLILSELYVRNLKVVSLEKRSMMQISAAEAAMMLSRPEFITVYEIIVGPEEFDNSLQDLTASTLLTVHENGRLFLSFHKNNNHVDRPIFRLNEDVFGLYYVTDFGQLIIAAYSIQGIHALEKELRRSAIARHLLPVSKYEFKEPVLYEFIQSDFEDFEEFISYIKD